MTTRSKTTFANEAAPPLPSMSPAEFASLGEGEVAYVKLMRTEEIRAAFPQAPELQPGLRMFALLGADGSPILLSDSKDAALANAWENDLTTVSVH
jgi:hypothetical protein